MSANSRAASPLLQYAITELFERRQNSLLTKAAYKEIGGVSGALGRRAEELHDSLDEEQKAATRQLFLRLVTLGEGVEDTRRRVQISELASMQKENKSGQIHVLDEVLEIFGNNRLLTFDSEPITREPTVEVAHEALLREWTRLREWLAESRADVRQQRLLAGAVAEWQEAGENDGFLLRGSRLEQFQGWAEETGVVLTQNEQTYLTRSVAARQAREQAEVDRQKKRVESGTSLGSEAERGASPNPNPQQPAICAVLSWDLPGC